MLADLPPCHIFAASHDILRDDAILFHKAAVAAGNENIQDWIKMFLNEKMIIFKVQSNNFFKSWRYGKVLHI